MLTLRVMHDRVVIKVDKTSKMILKQHAARLRRAAAESEFLEPSISDAITKWATAEATNPTECEKCEPTKPDVPPAQMEDFSIRERTLCIYDDAITVCGVCLWTETSNADLRKALLRLNRRRASSYEHVSGSVLMAMVKRNPSNPIARPMKDFRDRAIVLLADFCQLRCDFNGIICSKRGYHFQPWIKVEVVDGPLRSVMEDQLQALKVPELPTAVDENTGFSDLNERQNWIVSQLKMCGQLRLKDIIKHTKCDRSTINRDLQGLRRRSLIITNQDGAYELFNVESLGHAHAGQLGMAGSREL